MLSVCLIQRLRLDSRTAPHNPSSVHFFLSKTDSSPVSLSIVFQISIQVNCQIAKRYPWVDHCHRLYLNTFWIITHFNSLKVPGRDWISGKVGMSDPLSSPNDHGHIRDQNNLDSLTVIIVLDIVSRVDAFTWVQVRMFSAWLLLVRLKANYMTQCNTIQCNTIPSNTIQTLQYKTMQYKTIKYKIINAIQ